MGNNLATRLHPQPVQSLDFDSYEQACLSDPDVKMVDNKFKDHTDNVINALAAHGVGENVLSFNSLKEVTTSLLDLNHEVMQVILSYKDDVWEDQELYLLVTEFFDNSLCTLEFCGATESSIKRVRDNQLMLNMALNLMPSDREPTITEAEKILNELDAFRKSENPFNKEFLSKFRAVKDRHTQMLEKLMVEKKRLDRKLRKIKLWAKVSSVIFAAVVGAVLICSVVAAAIAAPPIAGALAAAASLPLGAVGSWVKSLWNRYENEIRSRKDLLASMHVGTFVAIRELENIDVLVRDLTTRLESIVATINFADDHRDALKVAIEEIYRQRRAFVTQLDDLEAHIHQVGHGIRDARAAVLQKINKGT